MSSCSLAEVGQALRVGRWVGRSNGESHSRPLSHHSCLFFGCTLALVSTARGFTSLLWFRLGLWEGKGERASSLGLCPEWSQRKSKIWSVLDTASVPGCLFLRLCLYWVEVPGNHHGELHPLESKHSCTHAHTHTPGASSCSQVFCCRNQGEMGMGQEGRAGPPL